MSETQLPQFIFTYYNPFDEKRPDFSDSLTSYVKDVQLANYTGKVIGKFLEQQSEQQLAAIADLNRDVSYGLKKIDNTLDDGFSQINQRLTLIQAEQFNTNLLLKDIKEILRQPDSEKQRMNHIKLGMKFFNHALKNEEIINDAIEEFEKALALMKQDWLTGYQLGLCHTYHNSVHDFEKAEKLFLNAAKYSAVDTLEGDDFKEYFYKAISIKSTNDNVLLDFAAECYLQVAFIRYVQSDFKGAVEFATKATQVSKTNAKCAFLLAKYQSRDGNYEHAIKSLRLSFQLSNQIYKVFIKDIDILNNPLFKENYKDLLIDIERENRNNSKINEEIEKKDDSKIFIEIYYACIKRMFNDDLDNYFDLGPGKDDSYTCKVLDLKNKISKIYFDSSLSALNKVFHSEFKDEHFKEEMQSIKHILNVETYKDLEIKLKQIRNQYESIQEKYITKRESGKYPESYLRTNETKELNEVGIGRYYYYLGKDRFLVYFDYLKQKKLFDKIKIESVNKRNEKICHQFLDYYLNRKDPKDLPKLDAIKKKWWESF